MIDRKNHNPETVAAELSAKVDLRADSVNYSVGLSSSNGYYQLTWSEDVTQTYDWVGLYPNADVPDSGYISGKNWQWAEYGNSYITDTPVSSGHQARYLVWDGVNRAYVAVAVSNIL
jgi:hypothetical protein